MRSRLTEALRGVVGMAHLASVGWEDRVLACRDSLDCLALTGSDEEVAMPASQAPTGEKMARIAGQTQFILSAAGIYSGSVEQMEHSLSYTRQTIERCRLAGDMGAAGALISTPLGLTPLAGQAASALVYRYFRDTQAKSPVPIVLYQPPGTPPDYRLRPESILSLVRLGKVRGLIMADGDAAEIEACARAGRRADFTLICDESLYPMAFQWGACGVTVSIDSANLESIAAEMHRR